VRFIPEKECNDFFGIVSAIMGDTDLAAFSFDDIKLTFGIVIIEACRNRSCRERYRCPGRGIKPKKIPSAVPSAPPKSDSS